MEQNLFNFDDDLEEIPEEPAAAEAVGPAEPTWNWWDPWPADLSRREQLIWQIRRDRRALLEEEDEEWWSEFYADRIVAYQNDVKQMDEDGRRSQQTETALAPGT